MLVLQLQNLCIVKEHNQPKPFGQVSRYTLTYTNPYWHT